MTPHYIPPTQPVLLEPTNKIEWVQYRDSECADKLQWGRCFNATYKYYMWLQEHHPEDFKRENEEQARQVREYKNRKF